MSEQCMQANINKWSNDQVINILVYPLDIRRIPFENLNNFLTAYDNYRAYRKFILFDFYTYVDSFHVCLCVRYCASLLFSPIVN